MSENPWLARWMALTDHLSTDFLGGPRLVKLAWVINAQKAGTLPFVLALMLRYDCWTNAAWIYAALHGSYGLIWLMKDLAFPDPNWQRRVTLGGAFSSFALVLGPYWLAPWLLISGAAGVPERPAWLLGGAALLYALGVAIMLAADAQKYFTLRVERGLITTGMFRFVRHPNYLGEMMLYAAFALVAGHWAPWLVLAWVWGGLFVPNMIRKERSMSRYPAWAEYRARTGWVLPGW